jgi:TatD DNase family protein
MECFFDVHCHVCDLKEFSPKPGYMQVASGYNAESNKETLLLSKKHHLPFTLGFAPQSLKLDYSWEETKEQIKQHANNPLFVAIGEIGLDFKWAKVEDERKAQELVFLDALELASKLNLPVVIHSRMAEEKVLNILSSFNVPFIMHCFSGSLSEAKRVVDLGGLISIPPLRSKERKRIIQNIDLSHFVLETDLPYIGKKIEDVVISARYVSEVKCLDIDIVKNKTKENALRFFNFNEF